MMKKLLYAILTLLAVNASGSVSYGATAGEEQFDPMAFTGSWTRKITETRDWYNWTFYLTFIYKDGQSFAQKGTGMLNISTGGKDYKVTLDYSSAGVYAVDGDNLTVHLDPSKTVIAATQEGLPEFVRGILGKVENHFRRTLAKPIKFKIVSVGENQIVLINANRERAVYDRNR